ncbi:pyroglutamyl peptidase [Nocardiopsis sp. MG754419]|uniref:pyroglutamyl peptidase n=1 Tax=Nocardiopsis sp. MG754419 TaxID=2259865 RepID=UPI001BAC45BB|nr:pyroglutamyl peptidase [Nocardiopsis sp. MG754419]MBR8743097.1 pyroglutamyl peptidase [Nocardiopsis sp. MG754419]
MRTDTTPEEDRARLPLPRRLLARSGFDAADPLFAADLRGATTYDQAREVVTSHASRLWTEATRTPTTGPVDDRPLYWARLTLSARLRSWRPSFDLTPREHTALLRLWERTSRGITDLDFPPGERWVRVVVTGFDPFHLDEDLECSNPSGAAALDLHGWTFPVGDRTAVVRAALFPVRWDDFADGLVEEALATRHGVADAVLTLSRGRPERFDLEVFNGAWRGGGPDNLGVSRTGPVPLTEGEAPQWSRSTLPVEHMVAGATGPFAVVANTEVTEVPSGGDRPSVRPEGPSEGSSARRGGGGDYLSNEIAYRNTVLRDRTGTGARSGHVHLPRTTRPEDHVPVLEQLRALVSAALENN